MKKMVLGLTGTIGAGKSTLSVLLRDEGFVIIDVDKLGHKLLQDESVMAMLVNEFGEDVVQSGAINRKTLGHKAFSNTESVEKLNKITHPKLTQIVIDEVQKYSLVVIDAALLFELNLHTLCDQCWFVDAPGQQRQKRLGAEKESFLKREKYQEPYHIKRDRCHRILVNDSTPDKLHEKITAILQEIK